MKGLVEIRLQLGSVKSARLRGEERASALKRIYSELTELERHVARHPDFMGFYEVGEMRKFIHEMQKLLGIE